ncbi:MAG: sigma-54 dependent transcriptional regulator [Bryobacterales bacterium]|nr:sigma-54 dependent transcriptional regulator [Bryobacterales bacterium]
MPKVLLTFTGFHDPFSKGLVGEEEQPGPIVTIVRAIRFDQVVLFSTPGTASHSRSTAEAIGIASPGTEVTVEDCQLMDPTDYDAIRRSLQSWIQKVGTSKETDHYFVSIASGTPQMHVTWLALVASGELEATILNTRPPRYVTKEKPLVSEVSIDLHALHLAGASVRPFTASAADRPQPGPTGIFAAWLDESEGPDAPLLSADELPEDQTLQDVEKTAKAIGIIGDHPEFLKILQKASLLAPTRYPILILGETGTGKELLARFIHHLSGRHKDCFVPINCAAIPKELVESTLFGHKKGSFTGAHEDRKGKFDAASGGTLFLDELGELPLEIQPKFLRVLQDGIVEPVGESKGHKVDVRVIAATNIDVEKAIRTGKLREDLFYRLKVGICHLPALRERRSDIQKIALFVLERVNASLRHPKRFSREGLAWLMARVWSGNIRDLENTIEGAAILTSGPEIGVKQLEMVGGETVFGKSSYSLPEPVEGFSMPEFLSDARRRLIGRALEISGGKQKVAAKLLGITPQALSKQINATD